MKIALIIALLLGMVGCSKKEEPKRPQVQQKEEQKEESPKIETVILNEYGHMTSELGTYELIFDGEILLEVDDNYIIDHVAFEYDEEFFADSNIGTVHIEGLFTYSCGKFYMTNLNTIEADFFYMGEGGGDFFQFDVKGNQIRYWLYSTGQANLRIYKIWRFIPYEQN